MKINGEHYRAIWLAEDNQTVKVINQKVLQEFLISVRIKRCFSQELMTFVRNQ